MLLSELAELKRRVTGTRGRRDKVRLLAEGLRRLGPAELGIGSAYLAGQLPHPRPGVGPALLADVAGVPAAPTSTLELAQVDARLRGLQRLRGAGSGARRADVLGGLLRLATPAEQGFLRDLLLGELRQGALEGLAIEAVALAFGVPVERVRRGAMLAGALHPVAEAAARDGRAGVDAFRLRLGVPFQPMLAQPADDLDEALRGIDAPLLEYKLDGARVQVHRDGEQLRVFTRQLREVTGAVPEIERLVRALPATRLVLDGEAVALRPDGRPRPFQETMQRFGRRQPDPALQQRLPLRGFFFDCLHLDGDDLLDLPLGERRRRLDAAVAPPHRVPWRRADAPAAARSFYEAALAAGHEGVVVKDPQAGYAAGSRGSAWRKLKRVHTLDLVVLAAEWGSGRRAGWLSNLHLGAYDPDSGGFVMLGKTFKGLTDELLRWQTGRLRALAVAEDGHAVQVRPELVVEVAFNDLQRSPHYPGGLALRFARVKRYRPDKTARQADTIAAVRALAEGRGAA